MTVYIIGNGLFGRVASDMLSREGVDNVIFSNDEVKAGSNASGNITKPSWVSGLGDRSRQAYKDLDEMYGLHKIQPDIGLGKHIDLYYVNREVILNKDHVHAAVDAVGDGWIKVGDRVLHGEILVAAGVWSKDLVPMPDIQAVTGVSFLFDKQKHQDKFSVWAPYKQSISYQFGNQVWFGDGQAILKGNWNGEERIKKALGHAKEHDLENPIQTNTGYRPYVKGHKSGYFEQVYEHTWVSTGGGKNGIVLAAIQGREFLEGIQHRDS